MDYSAYPFIKAAQRTLIERQRTFVVRAHRSGAASMHLQTGFLDFRER